MGLQALPRGLKVRRLGTGLLVRPHLDSTAFSRSTLCMPKCPHHNLLLLQDQAPDLLRCRQCHLTISQAELGRGYCPECLEARGERHADFEKVGPKQARLVRYRCEDCGAVLEVPRD